jgi:hypothetical protein
MLEQLFVLVHMQLHLLLYQQELRLLRQALQVLLLPEQVL